MENLMKREHHWFWFVQNTFCGLHVTPRRSAKRKVQKPLVQFFARKSKKFHTNGIMKMAKGHRSKWHILGLIKFIWSMKKVVLIPWTTKYLFRLLFLFMWCDSAAATSHIHTDMSVNYLLDAFEHHCCGWSSNIYEHPMYVA